MKRAKVLPGHSRLGGKPPLTAVFVHCVALALFGCERDEVTERDVPKGVERIADINEDRASEAAESERQQPPPHAKTSWDTPEGWRLVPTDQAMRLATFEVRGPGDNDELIAEVSLTRFPGDVGGELANINRWRRQVGLESIGEAEAESAIDRFGGADRPGYAVRLEGESSVLLAAALYETGLDRTWFVKSVVGSPAVANMLQPQIVAFAESLASDHNATADGAESGKDPTPPRSPDGAR